MALDIVFGIIIVLFAAVGWRRGFVKSLIGALSTILSVVIAWFIYKPLSAFLCTTPLYDAIKNIASTITGAGGSGSYSEAMPKAIRALVETSASAAAASAADSVASLLLNICSILIVIMAAKLILWVISRLVGIVASLPVIRHIDALLGGALGVVIGVIVLCVVCAFLTLFISAPNAQWIAEQLNTSNLAKYIYDNNFILKILG